MKYVEPKMRPKMQREPVNLMMLLVIATVVGGVGLMIFG